MDIRRSAGFSGGVGLLSPAHALAAMLLVRGRGATAGIAALASAYFIPTDPQLDRAISTAVINQINDDWTHVFVILLAGALLALAGTVVQAVGLLRSHTVPKWVPIASLAVVLTFVVPGNGWVGTLTSLPTAASSIGLGYFAWRRYARVATSDAT